MSKSESIQTSFLSGVLDPRASSRIETDAYQQGLLTGRNIIPLHLGGIRRRPGLRYCATAPNTLSVVAPSSATAPNGGTAANASDDSLATSVVTTAGVSTTDPYVVVRYDLGSSTAVDYATAEGIYSDGGSSTQFRIQYSTDDITWTTLGTAFSAIDTSSRTYTRIGPITARYWRVAKIGGTDMGTALITLQNFTLMAESATVSRGRSIPFEITTDDQYIVVLTHRMASIYQSGALVQSVQMPYDQTDLVDIDADNDAETMVIVHPDYPPRFLFREGASNFQTEEIEFDYVPTFDFADSLSPTPTSDVQLMTFGAGWVEGELFQVSLDGAQSGSITYAGDTVAADQEATADNIRRAVQSLYTVPGFLGVSVARTGTREYTITLANGSADAYRKMSATAVSSSAKIVCSHIVTGVPRVENIWSATRGYPRTVCFFGERLWFGGTKSRENALLGSQVGNILDFTIGEGLDDEALNLGLTGSKLNSIQGLFPGRTLQIFTAAGEFRFVKDDGAPIVPGDKPFLQTQYGSAKRRPVTIDGATLYVQKTRKSIRDFRYDYQQVSFDSLGVSALAPHLINDVVDIGAWNGSRTDEIGLVFVINGDGTAAIYNSRAEAKLQAWTNWDTYGLFKSVAVVREDVFFLVRRTINAVDYLFLEQMDQDCYTDAAVLFSSATAYTALTGLSHLNGEECRVRSDGAARTNLTPSGGTATLEVAALEAEVGLDWTVEVTPMPLVANSPNGPSFMKKRRVVKVYAKLRETLGLYVNGQLIPDFLIDVDSFDTAPTPFTGIRDLEESTNWDSADEKTITFTQQDPLPFEIEALQFTMETT